MESYAEAPARTKILDRLSILLAIATALLAWLLEFVAPIHKEQPVLSDPSSYYYALPLLAVASIAALAAMRQVWRGHAAIALILLGTWLLAATIYNGGADWRLLHSLDLVLAGTSLISGLGLARSASQQLALRRVKLIWPLLAGAAAIGWIVGVWLPWDAFDMTYEKAGRLVTEPAGTCCWAFASGDPWLTHVGEAAVMAVILVAAVVTTHVRSSTVAGTGLVALAVLYVPECIAWIVEDLASPTVDRADLRYLDLDTDTIQSLDATVTISGMLGGWLALASLIALFLLGLARARAKAPDAT